jgi:hypothetical protein
MVAKNPKRRENEAIWDEMRRRASDADVRPTPLSKARTVSGNPRFGDLTASLNREVPKKFDPLTGASPLLNPAPAAPAAPGTPPKPAMPLIGQVGQFLDRAGAAVKAAFGGGNGAGSAPGAALAAQPEGFVWMGKFGNDGTSGARVKATGQAMVDRLTQSGYTRLGDTPSAEEQAVFGTADPLADVDDITEAVLYRELSSEQFRGYADAQQRKRANTLTSTEQTRSMGYPI